MAKGSGSTRNNNNSNLIHRLEKSENWFISTGINRYNNEPNKDYSDMSDLSTDEKRVLVAYLTNSSREINKSLRGEIEDKDASLLADLVSKSVKKLKSYQGETYRQVKFEREKDYKNFISLYKKGEIITEKGFISSGLNKQKITKKFYGNYEVKFTIKSKNGKNITHYNNEEKEILFDRNTKFKVISIRGNNIKLEEV